MSEFNKTERLRSVYRKAIEAAEQLHRRAKTALVLATVPKNKKRAELMAAQIRYFIERAKTQYDKVQILDDDGALRGACEKFDKVFKGFVQDAEDFEKELMEIEQDF